MSNWESIPGTSELYPQPHGSVYVQLGYSVFPLQVENDQKKKKKITFMKAWKGSFKASSNPGTLKKLGVSLGPK